MKNIIKITLVSAMLAFVFIGCEKDDVNVKSNEILFKAAETGGGTKPIMRTFYYGNVNGLVYAFCAPPIGDCLPTAEIISYRIEQIRSVHEMKGDMSKCMANFFKSEEIALSKVMRGDFIKNVIDGNYKVDMIESDQIYYAIFKGNDDNIIYVFPIKEN